LDFERSTSDEEFKETLCAVCGAELSELPAVIDVILAPI
jgi:hypothetical protein